MSRGLTGTLQGVFWATAILSVVTAIAALNARSAFNTWQESESFGALSDLVDADDSLGGVTFLSWLASLVVLVLMMIWSNLSHKATQDLWHGDRKWSSGWTVGGWFIPFANWVIPKLVLNEIERIALAPRRNGRAEMDRSRTTPVGRAWWLLFVAGLIVGRLTGYQVIEDWDGTDASLRTGYTLVAIGHGLLAISAVFGAIYVRRIGNALSPDKTRTAEAERLAAAPRPPAPTS